MANLERDKAAADMTKLDTYSLHLMPTMIAESQSFAEAAKKANDAAIALLKVNYGSKA